MRSWAFPETATDEEIKKAYRNLARKYHPDNYHDSPLADLAQEKMKEINAAYEQITKAAQRLGPGGYGGLSGRALTAATEIRAMAGGHPCLQQVRYAIHIGDLSRAEALLAGYGDHNAEWNFLKGAVCYRRGWMDEAKRYYETACQMDPGNAEYRQALDYMENGAPAGVSPRRQPSSGRRSVRRESSACPCAACGLLCSGGVPIICC